MRSYKLAFVVFSIIFFIICIVGIIHLFFYFDRESRKTILSIALVYGGLNSATEIYKHRSLPNYGISVCRAVGGTLGLIAGFYFGCQASISAGIGYIQSSGIVVGICFASGVANMNLGSFLGNILQSRLLNSKS